MDLYSGGVLFPLSKACAGSMMLSNDGYTKYTTLVRAMLEFVTALCSTPTSLPLLIICNES